MCARGVGARGAGARGATLARPLVLAAAAVAGLLCAGPPPALAGDAPRSEDSPAIAGARRRWWLDLYAHSMQEQAFIAWMDAWFGAPTWRHSMQEREVNALFAWWSAMFWREPPAQALD
ncbi:MAG: hypothetical protein U0625_00740 [Phycisphaerales bacterium]